MNYYEELGVSPTATTEQIRHSYKGLARLLHPDQIQDEALKPLAALQMRRLNQILSVLTGAEDRRRYDTHLRAPVAMPALRPQDAVRMTPASDRQWLRPLTIGLIAWLPPVAGLIIFVAAMISYGAGGREAAPVHAPESVAAASSPTPPVLLLPAPASPSAMDQEKLASDLKAAQRELEALRSEHQRTLEQLAMTRSLSHDEPLPETPLAASRPAPQEAKPLIAAVRAELPVTDRPAAPWKFAGHWYYVPEPRQSPSKGVYLPEYIELRLNEDGGTVHGRYRARYRVTDQAISPEVLFQFEGTGNVPTTQLPWTGPGAAKGRVTLRLVSADQLEVEWTASQLSAELNLASGSARLIRQKEQ